MKPSCISLTLSIIDYYKMEVLDRELQLDMLTRLAEVYPRPLSLFDESHAGESWENHKLVVNVFYLNEHGLIRDNSDFMLSGAIFNQGTTITAKGLDFFAQDGGLSAILSKVTIQFDEETLKAILLNKINDSNLELSQKEQLKETIQSLPSESIKHLTTALLDKGLESVPDAGNFIFNTLSTLFN